VTGFGSSLSHVSETEPTVLARLATFAAFLGMALAAVLAPSAALAHTGGSSSAGTVKVDDVALNDSSDDEGFDYHTGCNFDLKWYSYGKGTTVNSTVSFAVTYPSSGVQLSVDGVTSLNVGADVAGGASDLDGNEDYTLGFYGAGYEGGYLVKLTVSTPEGSGTDTEQKYFWVTGCAPASPSMQLTKTAADSNDADSIGSLGETLTYSFTVKNTGNVPLTNVKVTDTKIPGFTTGATCVATLAAGATTTCPSLPVATHVVTGDDISRGSFVNTATASGTPAKGDPASSTATATMSTPATPSILLTKTVADSNDADTIGSIGEALTYSFTVKNTGNVPLTNVKVTDAMIPALVSGATCAGTLAVGATTSCPSLPAATHVVNADDITKGKVDNTAAGTATPPSGANVTSQASATIPSPATPSVQLTKTVADSNDADTIGSLGETLTYSFTVKNTGNVPLTNVKVTDAMIPALVSGASCAGTLAAGATTTCPSLPAATHVVNADDIARGSVANTATSAATPPTGPNVTSSASATIATPAAPAISMTKSVADSDDSDTLASETERLTYSFTVTNTGNVPLTNVKITDPMIPALASGATCVNTLAVGATTTCPSLPAATHTVTGAEAAKSSIVNTASGAATPPSGANVTSQASASITTQPTNAAITMTKAVADSNDADSIGSLGETLTYSFTVRNTGNVVLTNVKVTDAMIPALASGAGCVNTLAVGATTSCPSLPVATHAVNAEDIARGTVVNTATSAATPPSGSNATATDTATIASPATPAFTMTKVVADSNDADSVASLGESLTYSFTVTNTGNVPLINVRVADAMIPALADGGVCVGTLAVGATTACPSLPTATHVVSADDIAKGRVDNTATTTGTTPSGARITTTDTATITAPAVPAIKLTKSVADSNDADSVGSLGETLTYTFTVKNTGNVPLTSVKITDATIPALSSGAVCAATLAVGATTTCTALPAATHVVNADDIAHGSADNTAIAAASPPAGAGVTSQASATIATPAAAGLSMTKKVTDSDDADELASEGETLTYSFTVKNTGNVPLTSIKVTDAMIPTLAGGAACIASLAVGATTTCPSLPTAAHVVTGAEAAHGSLSNTATTSATPPAGADVDTNATATIATRPSAASITMTKSVADSDDADNLGSEGEKLTYSFTVTNTGNVALGNVRVTDAMIPALAGGATCVATLAVGATTSCPSLPAATHTVSAANVAHGSVDNIAGSSATPPSGSAVTASGAVSIATKETAPTAAPGITMTKSVADSDDADNLASEGEKLTYSFTVTNTGNVALGNVKVTDAMIPALAGGAACVAALAVGATTSCPSLPAATHTVSAAEAATSSVDNTATAAATPPTGSAVTATDTATIATKSAPPAPDASISLEKSVTDTDGDDLASRDEVLTYSFTVTNTGQTPLTGVTVTDPMIPALANGAACAATLAVGATTDCPALPAATYTVTAQDVDAGSVVNIASGSATPPTGSAVTATDSVVLGTYKPTTTDPGPFSWDWTYEDPACSALTVTYPSNIPDGQANDVNIRFETNLGPLTLNFHNNDGFWGETTSFPYASHPSWPAGITSYRVVWTQVGGTNYHWQGNVRCLIDDDGDPTTVDDVLGVTTILGWRTSTVTVKKGATVTSDAVVVGQLGDEDLVLQRLSGSTWVDVKTVTVDDSAARVTFGRQTRKGTFKYRLAVDGSTEVTGATTSLFTVRVR
jgi:uncharacterized repeat protein (TIGR01451 family)